MLGAVKTVNLVNEQECTVSHFPSFARCVEDFAQIGDTREDRRQGLKFKFGVMGEQTRDGGFARTGRTPKHDRGEPSRSHHAPDGRFRRKQVRLADDLI